jgi:SAM-dependent methyltransferase
VPSSERSWHEDFFTGLWLEAQQNSFDREQSRSEAEGIQALLQLLPGERVLDIPCGNGRIAVELARRGCVVRGVDRSRPLLQAAQVLARSRGVEVLWSEGDMWQLDVDETFDAAVCMWGSLGYEDEEHDRRFLGAVADRLRPGGSFLIDVHVAETLLAHFEERHWRWAGNVLVLEERSYDSLAGRIETDWTLSRGNEQEHRHSSLRLYTVHELHNLLIDNGFSQIEVYGSLDGEPFELGASRLILVGRRPGNAESAER